MMLHSSVAETMERIDSQEFAAWQAFDRCDPFGEQRADLRSAQIAMVIANANRGRTQRAFKIDDFMFDFSKSRHRQGADDMQQKLFEFAAIHNQALKA